MKRYLRYLIVILIGLPLIAQDRPQNEPDESIAGFYSSSTGLTVSFIHIKPDLTFEYRVYGDLFSGNGNIGRLTPMGGNYYMANSFPQLHTYQRWIFDTGSDSITITVIDEDSSILESGTGNIFVNDTLIFRTDKIGNFKLPKRRIRTVRTYFPGYVDVEDTLGSELWVDSIVYQIDQKSINDIPIENERWLIKNDSIIGMWNDTLNYSDVHEKTAFPSANETYTVKSGNGVYAIEMIPTYAYGNEGKGNVYQIKAGQGKKLMWSINWFAQNVSLANDGIHLIRLEPWGSDLEKFSDIALEFYRKDQLLNSYRVNDILKDTSTVIKDIGHYRHTAHKGSIQTGLIDEKKTFTIVHTDKRANSFDFTSGELIEESLDLSAFRTQRELRLYKENKAKELSSKMFKQTPAFKVFQQDFKVSGGLAGGYISGLYLNENRAFEDAFKDWRGKFVPHKEYPVPVQVNITFTTSDSQIVNVDILPNQLLEAIDEIAATITGFDSLHVNGIRLRAAGNRLHWNSKEAEAYMQLLEKNNEASAPLKSWVYFIVDTPKGAVSFYHPMGSNLYICNYGLLNVDYWKKLYLQKRNLEDTEQKVYYEPLTTYCAVFDKSGDIRFLKTDKD